MTGFFDILKKKGSFVVLLAGVSLVVAAGTLLARFVFNSAPPDVSKAEMSEIAKFTKSEDFLKMNSKDRVDFADALLARYLQMTPEERAKSRGMFSGMRSSRATREAFFLDWSIKRAREFAKLPTDEQDAYVDRWLDVAQTLAGGRGMQGPPGGRGGPGSPPRMDTPSRSDVAEMQRNMKRVLGKTSAKDRPRVAKLSGAVIRRMRERREQ